jgi:hypothetical protein
MDRWWGMVATLALSTGMTLEAWVTRPKTSLSDVEDREDEDDGLALAQERVRRERHAPARVGGASETIDNLMRSVRNVPIS